MMDKKQIQRQRMKEYFINAAKELVLEEGIKNVTVRKVADIAGYSYATIYNYFRDIDTLMLYCINEFLEECYQYVSSEKHPKTSLEQIKSMAKSYIEFFIKYPQAFQLVFVEFISVEPPEELKENLSNPKIAILLYEALQTYATERGLSIDETYTLRQIISNFLHGRLLFHIKRNLDKNDEEFIETVLKELEFILR